MFFFHVMGESMGVESDDGRNKSNEETKISNVAFVNGEPSSETLERNM
jgi:hypothetical protein